MHSPQRDDKASGNDKFPVFLSAHSVVLASQPNSSLPGLLSCVSNLLVQR